MVHPYTKNHTPLKIIVFHPPKTFALWQQLLWDIGIHTKKLLFTCMQQSNAREDDPMFDYY